MEISRSCEDFKQNEINLYKAYSAGSSLQMCQGSRVLCQLVSSQRVLAGIRRSPVFIADLHVDICGEFACVIDMDVDAFCSDA